MPPVALNEDIFAMVVDEVVSLLNVYRTKDLIDFANRLRLVSHATDQRLQPRTSRFLDVPSHRALVRLVHDGVPNHATHVSITVRAHPFQEGARFYRLVGAYVNSTVLQRVILDLRKVDTETLTLLVSAPITLPPSVQELAILSGSMPDHTGAMALLLDNFLHNQHPSKLAVCGVPIRSLKWDRFRGGEALALLLIDTGHTSGAWEMELEYIAKMERRDDDVHPVLVRLAFAEDINRAALDLWMNDLQRDRPSTPKFTFEELLPDTHYEHAIDWFADRVQDGTIWTMKGRLLEQVNGEGE